ncbi:MAG TPA: hypothetical protein VFB32_12490 [Rudaea sp.]|nr:hypothetical protein [Rudaea sp.]
MRSIYWRAGLLLIGLMLIAALEATAMGGYGRSAADPAAIAGLR